ncbi:site-specific integrase [Chryseobacterium nematophagum]|nr:site-specific integrase [Chryseobacterium nematophagum]
MPNDKAIKVNSIYDMASKYLKLVGLEITGYSLKHTFLNLVAKQFGISKAAELAGHTNNKTTLTYAIEYAEHLVEQNKKIDIKI